MRILFAIVLVVLVAQSCTHRIAPSSDHQKKDSVSVREVITMRDTIVYTPVDSACIRAEVICPPDGTSVNMARVTQHSKQATVTVEIKDGKLNATCECDSVKHQLKLTEVERDYYRMTSESDKRVEVIQVKFIPKLVKVFAWIGGIVAAGVVFYLIFKFGFKLI